MKHLTAAIAASLLLGCGCADAACPPLSAYQVSGITTSGNLSQAASLLFASTAWTVKTDPDGTSIPVSLNGVGGPLDKVLNAVVARANDDNWMVSTTANAADCVVDVNVIKRAPVPSPTAHVATAAPILNAHGAVTPTTTSTTAAATYATTPGATPTAVTIMPGATGDAPAAPAHTAYVLHAHEMLSKALQKYVAASGWHLKWNVSDDYLLTVDLPIPDAGNVIDGVSYVIRTYKAQGGFLGVTLAFYKPNRVVALAPTSATIHTGTDSVESN